MDEERKGKASCNDVDRYTQRSRVIEVCLIPAAASELRRGVHKTTTNEIHHVDSCPAAKPKKVSEYREVLLGHHCTSPLLFSHNIQQLAMSKCLAGNFIFGTLFACNSEGKFTTVAVEFEE